jgi:dihydrofolate reductase
MRPLHYSIQVTLDGCVDHRVGVPDAEVHLHATQSIASADALIFGRTTYELMAFWRDPGEIPDWMQPFADAINPAKKYLVSSTLEADASWNAENLTGDPVEAVRALKQQPGGHLFVGGVQLALALAEAGLIDEYEFVVHPRLAGHGPTLFAGLSRVVELEPIGVTEFASGARAQRYAPVGSS